MPKSGEWFLACEIPREAMQLYRKLGSPFWWHDFYFEGKRYRASTGEKTKAAAGTVAATALTRLTEGSTLTKRSHRAPILRKFSERFLAWVQDSRNIKPKTRQFYLYGWRLLSLTRLASMPIDQIDKETIDCTSFRRPVIDRHTGLATDEIVDCSPAYTSNALRTLKRMLGLAEEWGVISKRPKSSVPAVPGRDRLIDGTAEAAFERELAGAKPARNSLHARLRFRAWLVFLVMQDAGMRPVEVYSIRVEDLHWADRRIWIPSGKSAKARRFVGMTERMHKELSTWCHGDEGPGWLFPSPNSKTGHINSIAQSFAGAKARAGIDSRIVPYAARHTYGTYTMRATGNTFAVMKQMGHASLRSMEPYQHQEIDQLLDAVNQRNTDRTPSQIAAA
jgi:integrase